MFVVLELGDSKSRFDPDRFHLKAHALLSSLFHGSPEVILQPFGPRSGRCKNMDMILPRKVLQKLKEYLGAIGAKC